MNPTRKTATNWLSVIGCWCVDYLTRFKIKKLILMPLIMSTFVVLAAANPNDEIFNFDDLFEGVSVNIANDWLIKLTKDAKLRDMFCQSSKLSINGTQLMMQGKAEEGAIALGKAVSINERILKIYRIDISKLENTVVKAREVKDVSSLKILTLNSKVLASCNS